MDESKETQAEPGGVNYKLQLTPEERESFNRFLKATGRKSGAWLRILMLESVKKWEQGNE